MSQTTEKDATASDVKAIVNRPVVDRTHEFSTPDNEVVVTLECGWEERFWVAGLTDEEYIKRARYIKNDMDG